MDRPRRRGVLATAAAVLGASILYELSMDSPAPSERPSMTDGGQPTVTDPETVQEQLESGLYVETVVSDLPDSPEAPAFGITADGIFQFRDSDAGWQHVSYGSVGAPVPLVRARQAMVGTTPSGRPLISNRDRTLYVDPNNGDDSGRGTQDDPLATIQEAVWRVPIYLRNQYVIDLATVPETPVTYDEDVIVPTVIGTGSAGKEDGADEAGPFLNLILRGKEGAPGAVEIGSVIFGNLVGTSVGNMYYVTITRNSPYDDEKHGISAYGTGEIKLFDVAFAEGPRNGILAYGARMKASRIDFGDDNVNTGLKAKRHASIIVHDSGGLTRGDAFRATSNSRITVVDGNSVGGRPKFRTLRGGLIYDGTEDRWVGLSGSSSVSDDSPNESGTLRNLAARSSHPDDPDPGAVWYVDGSGDVDEGFYGRRNGDLVRFD